MTAGNSLEQQFIEVYRTHSDSVYNYFYQHGFSQAVAEQLVKDTYLRAWKHLAKGNAADDLKELIFQEAKNMIVGPTIGKLLNA